MTKAELSKIRKDLLAEKEAFEKTIEQRYSEAAIQYVQEHSPVEKMKVYTVQESYGKPRKFKKCTRFIVYALKLTWFDDHAMIDAWGWWLDENNTPVKWSSCAVEGVGNPTILTLAEDQTHLPHPHPDADAEK